jgi:hypothetical protein
MDDTRNHILQVTDAVSSRRFALRLEPGDDALPVTDLLEKYLKRPDLELLLREGRITKDSTEMLESVQDLVYVSDDSGRLHDMFAGIAFKQGSRTLQPDEAPEPEPVRLGEKNVLLTDLLIDRTNVGYDRNWVGFGRRRWALHADVYSAFVLSCLEEADGPAQAAAVLELDSPDDQLRLIEALARRIWESDFENYSRFTGRRLVYKSGDETVRNIVEGAGGICSEKVQALKFLTDHYGIESEIVLAGPDVQRPVPEARLREMLSTFDFRYSRRHMRYWQHIALLYSIGGSSLLVDATNGNIPFLFLRGPAADTLMGYSPKVGVKVRMAVHEEEFYYHRVSQDIGDRLFFAMEGWISHVDLVQVFDNELGLSITRDYLVTPIVSRDGKGFDKLRQEYLQVCQRAGLRCDVSALWDLESPQGRLYAEREPRAAERILSAKDHLLARYDDCHGPGHEAGLVVIALRG